jgi:pilus assembly protein FimV
VHNTKLKRISLAVCFALLPMTADAAGLGKLTVMSGLGEPLNAEVELLSTSNEELASLSAQIAPSETFAEQGIERSSSMSSVRVEVGKRPDGTPVLRLTSPQPINDPFLDMLIQVEWSSGRLLREYTALLDPPGYGERPVAPAAALPTVESAPVPSAAETATEIAPETAKPQKSPMPEAEMAPAEETGSHTVQKGDTLHAIAKQMQVEGVSLEQMLVGLYRANGDAFAGSNMNRLKVGKIIRLPSKEELEAVGQPEAIKEIRVQTADWNAYRNKLAGMVAESAPAKEEATPQAATGKITAPAVDKSAAPAPGPHDVVKLSKSETGGTGKAGKGGEAARLNALQEEATAREKAIKESGERVASLEKQLQDMQKLMEIKNKPLADMQKSATAKAPEQAKVEPAKPAPPVVQPPKAVSAPPAPPAATVPEQPKAEVAEPAAVAKHEMPKPPAKAADKKPKKIAPPPPKEEPGLFDALTNNLLPLAGGGGLLALIGGVWFYLRNKRRKGLDSFEQGILTSGGLKPNTVFGNTAGGTIDTGNSSFLTDFGQGASAGMIDTSEVDPIAEAEVYMAYGRDAQAEEILKDAITKEPLRHELHLKLLEIYAARKDSSAFETLAGELYATLGASDPTWAKAAEIGRKFEPDNPLYAEAATHPKTGAEAGGEELGQKPPAEALAEAGSGVDIAVGGAAETSLDFSLDEALEAPQNVEQVSAEGNALDFDIGSLELPSEAPATEVTEEKLPDIGASDFDLDISAADISAPQDAKAESATEVKPADETAGLDFQLDFPEPAAADAAKLDAADLGIGAAPASLAGEKPEVSLELPALDVAEASSTLAAAAESSLPDIGMSLDMPADTEEISLDMPTGESLAESVSLDIDLTEPVELPATSAAAPDVDKTAKLELPAETAAATSEITLGSTEAPAEAASGLDFDFNIDLGEANPPAEAPASTAEQQPDIDLSGISLEVDEGVPVAEGALSSSESSDVDTKLDLVTAYVDMGDKDGARELLQEVLKEGGPGQREKAQKLMASLG